ncbi:alpha,alpha-phosphotrehalase [Vagococcus luciliae]|uniref:Alpha,alpha-phosphotrehalase n=1 Tax=Vagococcus luciliae TaxID=2920380 RepID=A0ABY5NZ24_9ENTE|nr:alpha,alpha-phosphotrehalase [Vagococcus luciliae]UUV98823.1 Trehalose-6-phosphate hydrolase [Vagococcus luciliae]
MSFKDKVIYQIYPKSFYDKNGDGVGDLQGIIEKLPYLETLGIDMIWLNPIYPSPQKDNGYDISNYIAIDPVFGTEDDFKELVKKARERNIEIMLDMVLNHVSIEHEWFKKAVNGDAYYQDFFILRSEPTNWESKFGGNAWSRFGQTDDYFLHLYDKTQADLNWRNPNVRKELYKVVDFWTNLGVKGLRFDVINVIGKDDVLKDATDMIGKAEYTDKPIAHTFIHEMNRETFGKDPSIITVGEMSSTTIENGILYTAPEREELSMIFNFHHLKVDYKDGKKWTIMPYNFNELKSTLHEWGTGMSKGNGWNALFWNNHDQPRAINRFVDWEHYRVRGSKMLAAAIHLNRGTPYVYMGEEIGMLDPQFDNLTSYQDVETHNAYTQLLEDGLSHDEAIEVIQHKSRDNSRTPMQWDNTDYAGFSKQEPWLSIGKYDDITVENELKNGSIFSFYQQLIQLRKEYQVISMGNYEPFEVENSRIYGYIRRYETDSLLVLNNFSDAPINVTIPDEFLSGNILISNVACETIEKELDIQPYQSLAIYVQK